MLRVVQQAAITTGVRRRHQHSGRGPLPAYRRRAAPRGLRFARGEAVRSPAVPGPVAGSHIWREPSLLCPPVADLAWCRAGVCRGSSTIPLTGRRAAVRCRSVRAGHLPHYVVAARRGGPPAPPALARGCVTTDPRPGTQAAARAPPTVGDTALINDVAACWWPGGDLASSPRRKKSRFAGRPQHRTPPLPRRCWFRRPGGQLSPIMVQISRRTMLHERRLTPDRALQLDGIAGAAWLGIRRFNAEGRGGWLC